MIVNFITIRLMLERGYISHQGEYALPSTLSIYFTLIAIVLREYNSASHATVDFFYSMKGQLNLKPSDKNSLRPLSLLFYLNIMLMTGLDKNLYEASSCVLIQVTEHITYIYTPANEVW